MKQTIFTKHAAQVAEIDRSFRRLFENRSPVVAISGSPGEVSPARRRAIDAVTMPLIDESNPSVRRPRAVVSLDGFTPILLHRAGNEDPYTVALQISQNLSSALARGATGKQMTSAVPSKGEIPENREIVAFLQNCQEVYELDSSDLGRNFGLVSIAQYPSLPEGRLYCIANLPLLLELPPLTTPEGISLSPKTLALDLRGETTSGKFELIATTDSRYSSARGNYPDSCSVLFAEPECGYDFTTDELKARGMIPPTSFHLFPDGNSLFRVFVRNGKAALFVPDSSGLKVPKSDDFRPNGIF